MGGGAVGSPANVQDVVEEMEDYGLVVAVPPGFPDVVSERDDSIRCWLPVGGFDKRDLLAGQPECISCSGGVAGSYDQKAAWGGLSNVILVDSSREVSLGVERESKLCVQLVYHRAD